MSEKHVNRKDVVFIHEKNNFIMFRLLNLSVSKILRIKFRIHYFCRVNKKRKIWKYILWTVLLAAVVIQFFRPAENTGGNKDNHISKVAAVSPRVARLLDNSCNDCHSNTTRYPWYSYVQPVGWWLAAHVKDGKKHLNFDEFAAYRPYRQFHKLEEIDELVAEQEMPLESYTWIHSGARLDAAQREILINWTKDMREVLKAKYPADSLVMPGKK